MSLAAALEAAYAQKLRAGAAFHALQFSRSASPRRLEALAQEFDKAAALIRAAADTISPTPKGEIEE